MRTAGPILSDTPNTDLQLFLPATMAMLFNSSTGAATPPSAYVGVLPPGGTDQAVLDTIAIPASATTSVKFNLLEIFLRTGILQSNNFATNTSQEAFGTANGPGPNATPGTSDPSGFGYREVNVVDNNANPISSNFGVNSRPPIASKLLPTLVGPELSGQSTSGILTTTVAANSKGIRIKWADLVFRVNGVALTSIGFTMWQYAAGVGHDISLVWSSTTAKTLTGAAVAINSQTYKLHRERITLLDVFGNPLTFIVADGSMLNSVINFVAPSGSTANLVGVILGCDYNFN